MTVFVPTLALFLTPGIFYLGALATAIPIIIHLLNKRRFRVVVWAAMDFLLAAQRRNARRLRFQRWLLLALRCLALLVLAAAIAQFFLGSNVIGSLGGGERSLVFIWDDAYPMAYRRDPKPSHFETARKILKDYLKTVSYGDKIALLGTAAATPVEASNNATPTETNDGLINKLTLDHQAVNRVIDTHQVTDQVANLPLALDHAIEVLKSTEQTSRSRTVILLTDLARSNLRSISNNSTPTGDSSEEATRQLLKRKIETLRTLAEVRIIDVGEADQANRAIVEFAPVRAAVVAGLPLELKLSICNATESPLLDHPITISVDGHLVATEKIARIGPGETKSTRLAVTLPTPGRHLIEARITGDLLPLDDVRRLVVNASREIPLLLVDGNPGDNRTLGSTTFLQLALAPTAETKNPGIFAPRVITELELPRIPLKNATGTTTPGSIYGSGFAAVVLSDTGRLDPTTLSNLQRYVDEGGLLILFPGGRTNANEFNQTLGGGDSASRNIHLLPAPYGQLIRPSAANENPDSTDNALSGGLHLDPQNYAHPVLAAFAAAAQGGKSSSLSGVQIERYLRLLVPQDPAVETILKFSDGNAAVISKKIGKGRVVQFAFSADTRWTSFPARTSYVPFMWELFFYGMARPTDNLTLELGMPLHLPADTAPTGLWNAPRGTKLPVITSVDRDKRAWLTSPPLMLAGPYGPAGGDTIVVVNTDPQGSDLRHLRPAEFAAALGLPAESVLTPTKNLAAAIMSEANQGKHAGELGHYLILLALALFVAESLLATLYSRYR